MERAKKRTTNKKRKKQNDTVVGFKGGIRCIQTKIANIRSEEGSKMNVYGTECIKYA